MVGIFVFICLFAYSSRKDVPICTKLGMLIPSDQEENRRVKIPGKFPEFDSQ
jgi:hypothetical protein